MPYILSSIKVPKKPHNYQLVTTFDLFSAVYTLFVEQNCAEHYVILFY